MDTTQHTATHPTRLWAGVDLAKRTFAGAIWGHQAFQDRRVRSFPRTEEGIAGFLDWLKAEAGPGTPLGVVMEATGAFGLEAGLWLTRLDPDLHVAIANPHRTCAYIASLGLRNKTDDLDARALAGYGQERRPRGWEPMRPEWKELQEFVRTRALLVEQQTAIRLSLKDHTRSAELAAQAMEQVLATLAEQIAALEEGISRLVKAHPDLKRCVGRMTSIKGIGLITAVTVLAEIGDPSRFLRSRQLAAFAGMSPRRKDSGTSVHGRTRMCKQGSALVRSTLYMAAQSAVRFNPDMARVYTEHIARGNHWRSGIGVVMRKLLVLMRAVVIADHDWVPQVRMVGMAVKA